MNKGILLAATLSLFSAPAFAQMSSGGTDRTFGNGNVESQRLGAPTGSTTMTSPGGEDRSLGNGNVESQRLGTTGSTTITRSPQGGTDRTLGNGNVESQGSGGSMR